MGLIAQITYANTYTDNSGSANSDYADVYITLINAETGQLTNGNNAIVGYSVIENGLTTPEEVRIPGQSILIYSGLINQTGIDQFGNFTSYYSKSFTITSVNAIPDSSPPVNACDLQISYISIDKPASAPGAADAQITVDATSSFLPLAYSMDNLAFQASNQFTGLTSGLKTIYVRDANSAGCAVNQQITIPVLSGLLVNDPSVTVNGNTSRWNAVFNPIVFTYQRKDFEIVAAALDSLSGNVKLSINANVSNVIVNDLVYVNTVPYKGVFTVKSVAGNSLIIDSPFTTTATGFININRLRPYYKLLTRITYQDHDLGRENTIISTNRPDNTGLIRADISNFLQSLVRVADESDFTKINFRDDNLSASYQVAYAESWDDGSTDGHITAWVPLADPYYAVYAAKQLGDPYGGNLAAYVPYTNLTSNRVSARWITDFAEPAYSNGYPFDIGFIYSEYLLGLNIYCKLSLLDINRNVLAGGPQTTNLINEDGSWLINQDGSKFIIDNQTTATTTLPSQLGLNRLLVNSDFPADVYYFVVGLYYKNTGLPARFDYDLVESVATQFIDGNGQLKVNDTAVVDIYSTGSGTYNIQAGSTYSFEANLTETTLAVNPTIRLTIFKNSAVIFDERVAAIPGASLVKTGIAQPGATYHAVIATEDTTETITPINIADDEPVVETDIQVIGDQVIRIDKNYDDNSVYLRWIGLSGAWNYFRFVYNQEITLDVQNATIIKNYVTDWANQQGIEEVISKTAGQKMKVMAEDLSVNDIKGLQSIKYSPKVQMLVNKNPVKWQTVVLNTATFSEYETINGTAPFSVTFNLPSINIQTQ